MVAGCSWAKIWSRVLCLHKRWSHAHRQPAPVVAILLRGSRNAARSFERFTEVAGFGRVLSFACQHP